MDKPIALVIQALLIILLIAFQPLLGPFGPIFIGAVFGVLVSRLRLAIMASLLVAFSYWFSISVYHDFQSFFLISRSIANMFGLPFEWLSYALSGLVAAVVSMAFSIASFYIKDLAQLPRRF